MLEVKLTDHWPNVHLKWPRRHQVENLRRQYLVSQAKQSSGYY